jgi:FdhD protein
MSCAETEAGCPACPPADADWQVQQSFHVTRIVGEQSVDGVDSVVEEVPVALVYNGVSHAVMLASPADLEDFALGFSLAEGIVASRSDIFDIEIVPLARGIEARIEIAGDCFVRLKERRRNLAGRTGCGLCGVDSIEQAVRPVAPVARSGVPPPATVLAALAALPELQALHRSTGGCHAAAWADRDGRIIAVREDVGRHNALDKLIGSLARSGTTADSGFVLVTSRASVEMVQKVAALGASTLVAVSAPTALAIRQAKEAGIAIFGFARPGRITCYNLPTD